MSGTQARPATTVASIQPIAFVHGHQFGGDRCRSCSHAEGAVAPGHRSPVEAAASGHTQPRRRGRRRNAREQGGGSRAALHQERARRQIQDSTRGLPSPRRSHHTDLLFKVQGEHARRVTDPQPGALSGSSIASGKPRDLTALLATDTGHLVPAPQLRESVVGSGSWLMRRWSRSRSCCASLSHQLTPAWLEISRRNAGLLVGGGLVACRRSRPSCARMCRREADRSQ
jgi:hypothetical protein